MVPPARRPRLYLSGGAAHGDSRGPELLVHYPNRHRGITERISTLSENSDRDRKFTPQDLAANNGSAGRPVYIAFQGKVYDVSGSDLWEGGQHMGAHAAGADLTGEFADAPHGEEVFERYPQ